MSNTSWLWIVQIRTTFRSNKWETIASFQDIEELKDFIYKDPLNPYMRILVLKYTIANYWVRKPYKGIYQINFDKVLNQLKEKFYPKDDVFIYHILGYENRKQTIPRLVLPHLKIDEAQAELDFIRDMYPLMHIEMQLVKKNSPVYLHAVENQTKFYKDIFIKVTTELKYGLIWNNEKINMPKEEEREEKFWEVIDNKKKCCICLTSKNSLCFIQLNKNRDEPCCSCNIEICNSCVGNILPRRCPTCRTGAEMIVTKYWSQGSPTSICEYEE
jgi:hypothetical protein